ncbi:S-layer homology domain-containing protein [Collinsella sp. An2]|uniref:S-layer homology domain-containing protein n=1 Tax=Collinsella sp. An2 TaxID=1965585 RepID=UPI000B3A835F|nr:S-layer homology domain-containing protein [Collinsella sp. An2]OUP06259.1 hypothetical protein B5F33_10305 [Collinsella sp. An2]
MRILNTRRGGRLVQPEITETVKASAKNAIRLTAMVGLGFLLAFMATPEIAMAEETNNASSEIVDEVVEGSNNEQINQGQDTEDAVYIGNQGYETLCEAVQQAEDGATLTLHKDASAGIQYAYQQKIPKSIYIDLNGFTLTVEDGQTIIIQNTATVTIKDSAGNSGKIVGNNGNGVINCLGNLTVESGQIVNRANASSGRTIVVNSGATFTMTGGVVSSESTVPNTIILTEAGAKVEISGGKLTGNREKATVIKLTGSSAKISGDAELYGAFGITLFTQDGYDDVPAAMSTLEMSGGSIDTKNFAISGNNLTSAGSTVTINDCSINTDEASIYWPMEGVLTINGGTITGLTALEAKMGTITIGGGTFTGTGTGKGTYSNGGSGDDGSALVFVGQLYGTSSGQYDTNRNLTVTVKNAQLNSRYANAVAVYNAGEEGQASDDGPTTNIDIASSVVMRPADGQDGIRLTSKEDGFTFNGDKVETGKVTVTNAELVNAAAQAQNKVETLTPGSGSSESATTTMYTLYSTLNRAIENASTAEEGKAEVKLLSDVTGDVTVPEKANIELNLNGKQVTGDIQGTGELAITGSGTIVGHVTGSNVSTGAGVNVVNPPYVPPVQSGNKVTVSDTKGGKVAVSPSRASKGDTVTITATPDEGKRVWTVSVTDKSGKAITVKKDSKDNTWTFSMPDSPATVKVSFVCDGGSSCPSRNLIDVKVGEWYHDAIDWAVENGVMTGYDDGSHKFGPDDTLTRSQLAATLYKKAGQPAVDASKVSSYTDCDASAWYAKAVAWATQQGLMTGYDDGFGRFDPDAELTREQLAVVFWRNAGKPGATADLAKFPDGSETSSWAEDAVEWAVSTGLLKGYDNTGELGPSGDLTRAQMATVMYRQANEE